MNGNVEIGGLPPPAPTNQASVTIQPQPFVKASSALSALCGVEPAMMLDTIKRQCFPGMSPDSVSDAQLAAFVSVANSLRINPMLPGFLYAMPVKSGGIVPLIGPDGVFKMLSEHPQIASWETEVFPEDVSMPPTHAITRIYRRGSEKPITYTAVMSEWKVQSNPNWNTRPRHMLSIRSLKQAARQVIHGIPMDDDEYKTSEINVTPPAEPVEPRSASPARAKKGVAAVKETKPVEPAAPAPVEVVATPVEVAPEPAPATVEPEVVTPAPEPAKPAAIAPLKENERRTVKVKITAAEAKMIPVKGNRTASVKATVEGGYVGEVWHLGGAKVDGDKVTADPLWKVGGMATITIHGAKKTDGTMSAIVDTIKPDDGETAEEF